MLIEILLFIIFLICLFFTINALQSRGYFSSNGNVRVAAENIAYIILLMVSTLVVVMSTVTFITELLICRFKSFPVNDNYVTVYRGKLIRTIYVNGEKNSSLPVIFAFTNVLETRLPDGVKMTVTFGKTFIDVATVVFSNGKSTILL